LPDCPGRNRPTASRVVAEEDSDMIISSLGYK
jgi:hypothetical protein